MFQHTVWKIELVVPGEAVDAFCRALEPLTVAVASFEVQGTGAWRIEGYAPGAPDHDGLLATVALVARQVDIPEPAFVCLPLEDRDWVRETQRASRPITAGRFFIHSSFNRDRRPAGCWPVEIDAGTAFGSGDHATTMGCLIALSALARRRKRVKAPLDVGAGSGILSIAMARAWPCRPLASDIDPEAVRVTRANAGRNGVGAAVRAVVGRGLSSRNVRGRAPYDLVVANILARPLKAMAADIVRCLTPDGVVVLSGILESQERQVLAAYRMQGLALRWRIGLMGWRTLVLARGRV